MGPGQKAKLLNLIDSEQASRADLQPLYTIDITVGRSPRLGVKCGAISIFKQNQVAKDFEDKLNPANFKPDDLVRAKARAAEIESEVNSHTEIMSQDPIMFKETEGRWLPWAVDKALELYDRFGGSAKISLKCPTLRIRMTRSPQEIARLRGDPRMLFPVLRDIDQLLAKGYSHDPWSNQVRRGRISADMAKR